ncbi:MAG: hypothetical protein KME45_19955 [Stenomitos rutilans HA7619-LM2]|jgi:hypothetical protein|nr:hypothetical protein [Stenomitos rutilans HA7619-LM2]
MENTLFNRAMFEFIQAFEIEEKYSRNDVRNALLKTQNRYSLNDIFEEERSRNNVENIMFLLTGQDNQEKINIPYLFGSRDDLKTTKGRILEGFYLGLLFYNFTSYKDGIRIFQCLGSLPSLVSTDRGYNNSRKGNEIFKVSPSVEYRGSIPYFEYLSNSNHLRYMGLFNVKSVKNSDCEVEQELQNSSTKLDPKQYRAICLEYIGSANLNVK